jgi:hypothetical protein
MKTGSHTTWSELVALTTSGTVAATIFCCLPFATGLVGAAVAAFGARLAPLRPYLSGLSLALVGYASYQAYRRDGSCAANSCTVRTVIRRRRVVLWAVWALVLALLTVSWWASWVIYWTL